MTTLHASDWDRDAALTTARILLEIKAVNFRPEEPYTFTSGWKSPVYIDCRRIIYVPRARQKICELAVEKIGADRDPLATVQVHRELLQAIRARDAALAAQRMRQHFNKLEDRLAKAIEHSQGNGSTDHTPLPILSSN